MLHEVNDSQELKELLNGPEEIVVLEFFDPQSDSCRALQPILQDLQKEWHGLVKFYRSHVGTAEKLAVCHEVRQVPTLIFFQRGKPVHRIERPRTMEDIRLILEDLSTPAGA